MTHFLIFPLLWLFHLVEFTNVYQFTQFLWHLTSSPWHMSFGVWNQQGKGTKELQVSSNTSIRKCSPFVQVVVFRSPVYFGRNSKLPFIQDGKNLISAQVSLFPKSCMNYAFHLLAAWNFKKNEYPINSTEGHPVIQHQAGALLASHTNFLCNSHCCLRPHGT